MAFDPAATADELVADLADGAVLAVMKDTSGAPMAALDVEEGRLADAVNQNAGRRAWDLWRTQVRAQVNW